MTVSRFLVSIWVPTHRTVVTAKVFILVFNSVQPLLSPLLLCIPFSSSINFSTPSSNYMEFLPVQAPPCGNTGTSNESNQPIPHERFTYRVLTRFPPIIFPIVNVTTRGLVIDYTHGFSPISFPIGLPVYERRENAEITP
jgi:hypothetical protein